SPEDQLRKGVFRKFFDDGEVRSFVALLRMAKLGLYRAEVGGNGRAFIIGGICRSQEQQNRYVLCSKVIHEQVESIIGMRMRERPGDLALNIVFDLYAETVRIRRQWWKPVAESCMQKRDLRFPGKCIFALFPLYLIFFVFP